MSTCENSVSKAKLAEKAKRYDEMFEAMKEVASLHVELTLEERNLLLVAYRNVIGTRRRIISSIEHKGENKAAEEKLQLNNDNHEQNENMELNDISSDMLNVLEKHLIPTASTDESRVFYYTLKGECYSYLGEFATGSNRKDAVENSLVSYKTASNIAMTSLPPEHPIRLNVALQFSKFYYEILNAPDLACRLALAAYDDANLHLTTLGEESYEESALIMQLLRANFTSDNQMGMSVAQERSEIQKHLSQFVVSEDDPGVIFDFMDSRLLEFAIIAVGYRDRGYQSGLLANYIDWNNLTSQEIMNGFRKFVRPPAGGYRQTNHMVAFIPNTLEEFCNVISLHDFPNYPKPGEISLYEKDGQLCSLPASEVDLTTSSGINLSSYPDINISRELCNHSSASHDDNKTVLIQVYEPLIKQLTRTFIENGLVAALEKAANSEPDAKTIVVSVANFALRIVNLCKTIQYYYHPYRRDHGVFSISKFAQTREWSRSLIRVMQWHPNVFKLAVAACDDSIRIYTDDKAAVVVLKNILQKCITTMAWRPLTHNELAVGCENGIIIWNITNVRTGKPITRFINLTHRNHSPVISINWDKTGNLLASASTSDSDILIWNPDLQCNEPLKRVGPPSSLLKFSPDGSRLFASTVGAVFRVWNTQNWMPERWTVPNGTIQSAVWSPCGGYLLFVTSEEPTLYSLQFIEQQLFATASLAKQALPIADLSKIKTSGRFDVGGQPQSLAWDSKGQHLAISFKDCPAIALFLTSVNKNMISIAPDSFLNGIGSAFPSYICFQETYKDAPNSVLTIGWSSGLVQYFPFI